MSIVLFSSPASDDDVGCQRDEQRQEEDAAEWKAEINGAAMLCFGCRVGGDEDRDQSDQ